MKNLGLLGGMSWESTVLYYQLLNRHIRQYIGLSHSLPCIIHSFDFAIIERLQVSEEWPQLSLLLCTAAQGLKLAGAKGIVICTNTMHKIAEDVARETGLPVLHIADFAGERIVAAGLKRVGLLAIWSEEIVAFTPSRFLPQASSIRVDSIRPPSSSPRIERGLKVIKKISQTSVDSSIVGVLSVWPSRYIQILLLCMSPKFFEY